MIWIDTRLKSTTITLRQKCSLYWVQLWLEILYRNVPYDFPMLIKKGPFFLVHLCIGFVFWIQTTSEDNTAQGRVTYYYYIHYCNLHISKRLNVSQVGILWYIDSLMDFLFFNELHFLFGIFFYFSWQNNKLVYLQRIGKVHIFWEGHKILRNLHLTFAICSAS